MNKKGQGMPLNVIVVAIVVLIVLIVIVVFFTGGFNTILQSVKGIQPATQTDAVAAQTKCSQLCIQAQSIADPTRWEDTGYCKQVNYKDWNGNGKPNGNVQSGLLAPCKSEIDSDYRCCWDVPISSFCSATIGGEQLSDKNCQTTQQNSTGIK